MDLNIPYSLNIPYCLNIPNHTKVQKWITHRPRILPHCICQTSSAHFAIKSVFQASKMPSKRTCKESCKSQNQKVLQLPSDTAACRANEVPYVTWPSQKGHLSCKAPFFVRHIFLQCTFSCKPVRYLFIYTKAHIHASRVASGSRI